MSLVLDASVIAKWYNQEPWSEKAARLKDEYVSGRLRLAAPTLALYEVGNAIRKNSQLTQEEARDACLSAAAFLRGIAEAPRPDEVSTILTLALRLELTYYDASYVHLATKHRVTFVTADNELIVKAAKAVTVVHLRDF